MKVVVLDESKKRKEQMTDMLEEQGNDVISCSATGEFMEAIEASGPDKIFLDVESWQHGIAIYNYFNFSKKLDDIAVVFYNAPENFINISDRTQNQDDKIYNKQTDIEEVVNNL